ncbi:hypothetical protein N9N28_16260, partial [Rubripirellula amarantea]|nr:hypothetical protein [Rubripirellula amarantea]
MSTQLAEQPWIVSIMLVALGVAAISAWLQTGKKPLAVIGGLCFLLIPGAFALASSWVTDREAVEAVIYEAAAAVEANDHQAAVAFIGDEKSKQMALAELPRFKFSMARVNRLDSIIVRDEGLPKTADVDMSVKVDVSGSRGGLQNVRVLRRLQLEFEKRGDE